jgi:hypothetical protein
MRRRRSGDQGLSEYAPRPRHEIKGRSGVAQAFFRSDPGDPSPLIVVYHIQKTAGTSLRRVVRANLPAADVEVIPNLSPSARTPVRLLDSYRRWYESLDEARRARLCCVMSHWAGYLLPALDRPAEALALVREPVDRTLSYYHFKQRRRGPERPLEPLEQLYETDAEGRVELMAQLCNWQSRALLSVFHDVSALEHSAGPPVDADLWRARLRDLVEHVFLVGVQDRFEQYVGLLVRRYGWQAFVPRSKVNPQRPPLSELPSQLRETILAYNWLDTELYELCRKVQMRREAEEQGSG